MNGRRYRLVSPPVGTHASSARTSASMEARKASSGRTGRAMRVAERPNRAALTCGRKVHTDPSAWR